MTAATQTQGADQAPPIRNIFQIPIEPGRYGEKGTWRMPDGHELECRSEYLGYTARWTVGYTDHTGLARRVTGGPQTPGPYAYLVPLPTVIAAHHETPAIVVQVNPGDVLNLGGQLFRIDDTAGRRELRYPQLVPLAALPQDDGLVAPAPLYAEAVCATCAQPIKLNAAGVWVADDAGEHCGFSHGAHAPLEDVACPAR